MKKPPLLKELEERKNKFEKTSKKESRDVELQEYFIKKD